VSREANDCGANVFSEVFKTQTGNFDASWYINNCPTTSPNGAGSTESISTSGVLSTNEYIPGGDSNSFGFCSIEKGVFPFAPNGVGSALSPASGISLTGTLTTATLSPPPSQYHLRN